MGFILFGILALISFGCYLEGKEIDRRSLKLTLSLLLSIIVPVIMSGSLDALINSGKIEGFTLYLILHTVIPTIAFAIFQLILYKITVFSGN